MKFVQVVGGLWLTSILLLQGCADWKLSNEQAPPNVLLILADDMGFSDLGCFGGEIETPHLDALAMKGMRFSHFYNSSRCCPSRGALLTGQYPHQVGMGCMVDWPPRAQPGPYQGYLTPGQTTIASGLKEAGYRALMVGKWHLGEEKEHWPLNYGFDRYYGLISGASSYFELIKKQKRVRKMALDSVRWEPPTEDFYMTQAFSDTAVNWIKQHDTDSALFMYLAYTTPHWPLHALEEDIARFEGKYRVGWDVLAQQRFERQKKMGLIADSLVLPPKPASIPDWEDLSEEEKKDWDRRMAVYAAMIYRMDQGIGQVVQALKEKGMYENTLIVFVSDNGATDADMSRRKLSVPGVPIGLQGSYASYKEPWAWLSNIPYQQYKKSSYWGGMQTSCIMHFPRFADQQQPMQTVPGHFIDLLPTALGLAGTDIPGGYQPEGIDLSPLVKGKSSEVISAERPIFLEHMGNQAVITRKWKLLKTTWETEWSLFDLEHDPLETRDLKKDFPEKVVELEKMYRSWEVRTGSFPLPDSLLE